MSSPSARSVAIAGAMISISSRPIAPPSPACGLSPATAMRGRSNAKASAHVAVDDARRRHDRPRDQRRGDVGERDMDRHRHNREQRRPDHHDGRRLAAPGRGEFAQEFGMAGMDEAGVVQRLFGDRVGDDCARGSAAHIVHGAFDRFQHGRRVGGIGPARPPRRAPPAARPAARGRKLRPRPPASSSRSASSSPSRSQVAASASGSASRKNGAPAPSRHAQSVSSRPMPAGSPMVSAIGAGLIARPPSP